MAEIATLHPVFGKQIADNSDQETSSASSESGLLFFVHRFPQGSRIVSRDDGTYDAFVECGSSAAAFEFTTQLRNLSLESIFTP